MVVRVGLVQLVTRLPGAVVGGFNCSSGGGAGRFWFPSLSRAVGGDERLLRGGVVGFVRSVGGWE